MNSLPKPAIIVRKSTAKYVATGFYNRFYRLWIWLIMALPGPIYGQSPALMFHHLGATDGLSQTSVLRLAQDNRGFMWLGTRNGLNRYDGHTLRVYKNKPGDPQSLDDNYILALLADRKGDLWIGTYEGLQRYRFDTDNFQRIPLRTIQAAGPARCRITCLFEDRKQRLWVGTDQGLYRLDDPVGMVFTRYVAHGSDGLASNYLRALTDDAAGNLWVGTAEGLTRMQPEGGGYRYQSYYQGQGTGSLSSSNITELCEDAQQRLWIGTRDGGINLMEKGSTSFRRFVHTGNSPNGPAHNFIRSIVPDGQGRLWIGTQEGLNLLDPASGRFQLWQHNPDMPLSLSQNSIYSVLKDAAGNLWIGTYFGGANIVYAYNTRFHPVQYDNAPGSLSNNVISGFAEDARGNLWIGTEGGGLNQWNRTTGKFNAFKYRPNDPISLGSNLVKDVCADRSGNIWAATHGGGLSLLPRGSGQFIQYRYQRGLPGTMPSEDASAVEEDSYGRLWVGTDAHGLWWLNRETQRFQNYLTDSSRKLNIPGLYVRCIYEDASRNLWVGTERGTAVLYAGTDTLTPWNALLADPRSSPSMATNCVLQDTKGRIWLGTSGEGIRLYLPAEKTVRSFTIAQGLPSNNVFGILQDDRGYLWISTDNGLSRMDLESQVFTNYNVYDGLPGNDFNFSAYFKDSRGEMYFGGFNGLSHFWPREVEINDKESAVMITGLLAGGQRIDPGDSTGLLSRNISLLQPLVLPYTQNVFTLEFSMLNFIKPAKNQYAYKLEGTDKDWVTGNGHTVTYTGLAPGKYTFLLKAANNDGRWSSKPVSLDITILPPFWRTWWAYTLYVLVLGAALFFAMRFLWLRARFRREAAMQQFKLDFFTNISHELRTHLSLIVGPVENLLLHHAENGPLKRQLTHVKSNADRLLHLVGEMMDLRKAETNHLELRPEKQNVVSFLHEIFSACEAAAGSKKVSMAFQSPRPAIDLWFDKVQLEKVFFNLLTNAIKFTPEGGHITLAVEESGDQVNVQVTDNGIGIPKAHIPKLFTTYYQVRNGDTHHAGYGLGLALAKSLVSLHQGTLTVESREATAQQRGYTCFTVSLPTGNSHLPPMPADTTVRRQTAPMPATADLPEGRREKEVILLAEDNAELRDFIRESLEGRYTVLEAENGDQGLSIAFEEIPDLVISDIMMPGTNGLQVCHTLKTDERTNHIPVILLTARTAHEQQVEGLQTGADAYITKPFSIQVLELQITNLLASRAAMRKRYAHQVTLQPRNIDIRNADEEFLNKAIEVIEAHMDDNDFGVAMLSTKLTMSQPVLYKKLKALTDMSVNDFVKSIKLKKAAALLLQRQHTVNEIAYMVGFNDRKYFSREFRKQFGKTPSEYAGGQSDSE